MKVLEYLKKYSALILITILVVSLIVIGYQYGINKMAKKIAKESEDRAKDVKKEADEIVAEILRANEDLEKDNLEKDKIIIASKANEKRLIEQRDEKARELKELKDKIQVASPESLVGISRHILNTNEIWWDKDREVAVLSLSAFRTVTTKLADWEDFTLSERPTLLKRLQEKDIRITALEGQVINLGTEVGGLKLAMLEKDNSYNVLNIAFNDLKKIKNKGGGLLTKLFWGFVGWGCNEVFNK